MIYSDESREIAPPASGMALAEPPAPDELPVPMPMTANRCRRLWQNVLIAALEDMTSVEDAMAYLRSRDGREVMELAGIDEVRRLNLTVAWARRPKTAAARIDQVARAREKAASDAERKAREARWKAERAAQLDAADPERADRTAARAARRAASASRQAA